jgi:hypothetical protein
VESVAAVEAPLEFSVFSTACTNWIDWDAALFSFACDGVGEVFRSL